ncbi:MAG: hypothetical protein ACXQS4_05505 [Methermicoccaceae archaeon]
MNVSDDELFGCLSDMKEQLRGIQSEVSTVKTDVAWLKRIVMITVVVIGGLFGIDTSGVLG